MENLINKLNFYKLIPYLVAKGIPTLPFPQFKAQSRDIIGSYYKEEACTAEELRATHHLANEQDTTRAQLRTFFFNVWRDWLHARLMHLSTR